MVSPLFFNGIRGERCYLEARNDAGPAGGGWSPANLLPRTLDSKRGGEGAERGVFLIAAGEDGVWGSPVETETAPEDAPILFGSVCAVGFVEEGAVVIEGKEAVSDANRNPEQVAVGGGELEAGGAAVIGAGAEIEEDVEDGTAEAGDNFGVRGGRYLKMHAAEDVAVGDRDEFFLQVKSDALLPERRSMKGLGKASAVVFKMGGLDEQQSGEVKGTNIHEIDGLRSKDTEDTK